MNIGYACLTVGVSNTHLKSCILKNVSETKLLELISYNLNSLENIIDYNIRNDIRLFRISSDLIPFGSSPVNTLKWWDIFSHQLSNIGNKIQKSGMRVSMHPGQYTVLNSPKEEVVKRAVEDLHYHVKVLDSLGLGSTNKIILHIGGVYNDKNKSIRRFIENYTALDSSLKQRIVIENDDKSYTIRDVLEISSIISAPVVFDNLHNKVNPCAENKGEHYWIDECNKTWKKEDGCQKIHYSQQNPSKKPGSHSWTIKIDEFMSFYEKLKRDDIDIMLEVKDKNLSAIKCINCTSSYKSIKALEVEWSKYKYNILESSPTDYVKIRKLLSYKAHYPAIEFYNLLENALDKEITIGNSINAALHVWGYFKDFASDKEKDHFFNNIKKYKEGKTSLKAIKNNLWKMAVKYNQSYLLNSYYSIILSGHS